MDEIEGAHSGEHICDVFVSIANEYEIQNKLGFFVMDNASNNDTFLKHLEINQHELGFNFDTNERRLRYVRNIIYQYPNGN